MEKWTLNVETNCADPAKEKAFNDWYDTVHLYDILDVPGVLQASRYELASPAEGQPKFLAVYEIETDDFSQTLTALGQQMNLITDSGRMSELCTVTGIRAYRQITPPVKRKGNA